MVSQVGDDSNLLAKILPDYPPYGKRILQDDGSWLTALQRNNVELVTEPIQKLIDNAIILEDGAEYPVDAVVYATGFETQKFLAPMKIVGNGGINLRDDWGDSARAYLGITVPKFPNFFMLYGPNTNLAHAGSIIFHSECQMHYILGCLKLLFDENMKAMECSEQVCEEYNNQMDSENARMVWGSPHVDNWYKNKDGRTTTNSPWRLVKYWALTKSPQNAEYVFYS